MTPTQQIDNQISEYTDWRGKFYSQLRKLILSVDSDITEDFKWGTAVFVKGSNIVAIGAMKDKVKLNFFKGASINDPKRLFNNGLESKNSRSIDFNSESKIDEVAIKDLVKQAANL